VAKGRDDRNGDSSPRRDVASRSPSPVDARKDASPVTNGRSPSPRDVDTNNHAGNNNRGSESPYS
jgi:hypothetical protein